MTKPTVCIGIPYYGLQGAGWWKPLVEMTSFLHQIGVDFRGIMAAGSMMVDGNRNQIVKSFMETKVEWLLWLDTDNIYTAAAVKRLFDVNKTLVSGVYFKKHKPHELIAYYKKPNALYKPLTVNDYERGEILPVSATGGGMLLTHRSVYEDIEANFTRYMDSRGCIRLFHNDDVKGDVEWDAKHVYDGQVRKGQLRERIRPLKDSLKDKAFPWFVLENGRTEDMFFFESADRVGHKVWLDTSVESGHMVGVTVTGEDARKEHAPQVVEKEIIEVETIPDSYIMEFSNAAASS